MISRHLRFAFFGGLLALTSGCPKPTVEDAGFDAGPPPCSADNCAGCCNDTGTCVTDTTPEACGTGGATCASCAMNQLCTAGACVAPPCTNDFVCEAGKICDLASGNCVMGQTCQQDFQCQSLNSEDRCYRYGQQCTCDVASNPGGNGTCRLRKGPCEECTADTECGSDVVIFGPPDGIGAGRCKTLPNDMSGKKYCSYQRVGQCACGTIDDGTGFCRPQSNSCDSVGCNVDPDCPSGAVCSVNRPDAGVGSCGGVCVPRCIWNFTTKDTNAPGCPPGQTCWVDSANLNPESIRYGAGRCKPPCDTNADCQFSASNPFGGTNLACDTETLTDGTPSAKRCRANGACMDNAECPELLDAGPYLGYCDRASFVCRDDCRTGSDPVTALPFKDCRPPFSCSNDAGVNFCRLETCTEQGGAGIACAQGEYCCGDDRNFDGTADPCPPLAQQNAAGCFKAPAPPFCTECGVGTPLTGNMVSLTDKMLADQECRGLVAPMWARCNDGGFSPNCSPLKPVCTYAGDKMAMGDGINVCSWPSVNDVGVVPLRYGDTPKTQIACPTNYSVQYVRPQVNANGNDYCTTNADCSQISDGGVGDGGVCEPDPTLRLMDGGFGKSCRCDAKSGTRQCPSFWLQGQDMMGNIVIEEKVESFCKDGVSGSRQFCIETAICTPPRGSVYKATTEFGCGL